VGKSETYVVHVPKLVTATLLIAVSAGMALMTRWLSAHAYQREPSFADIISMLRRYDAGSATSSAVLATIAPAIADALFFIPFGVLAFLTFDRLDRRRRVTYAATMSLGVAFALGLMAWQEVLPARVTGGLDTLWNVAGCAVGATLGHARKRIRIRFV
jgi:glycopeptide antibiotics resistance protein